MTHVESYSAAIGGSGLWCCMARGPTVRFMTVKLVVLYTQPNDTADFDQIAPPGSRMLVAAVDE